MGKSNQNKTIANVSYFHALFNIKYKKIPLLK